MRVRMQSHDTIQKRFLSSPGEKSCQLSALDGYQIQQVRQITAMAWAEQHDQTLQCGAGYSVQLWNRTCDRIRSSRLLPLAAAARNVHEGILEWQALCM